MFSDSLLQEVVAKAWFTSGGDYIHRMLSIKTALICCAIVGCNSSNGVSEDARIANKQPKAVDLQTNENDFRYLRKEVDLGVVRPDSQTPASFFVENTSAEDWEIAEFKTTCGCAVLSSDWDTILPGESKVVHLEFTAPHGEGLLSKQVSMRFHQASAPVVVVKVSANVLKSVNIDPPELEFVFRSKTSAKQQLLTVTNSSGVDWRHLRTMVTSDGLEFSVKRSNTDVNTSQTFNLTVTCDPAKYASSDFREMAKLNATIIQDGQEQEIEVGRLPVRVSVREAIEVTPNTLFLGRVVRGQSKRAKLLVSFNADKPDKSALNDMFRIESSDPSMTANMVSVKARTEDVFEVEIELELLGTIVEPSVFLTLSCPSHGFRSDGLRVVYSTSQIEASDE